MPTPRSDSRSKLIAVLALITFLAVIWAGGGRVISRIAHSAPSAPVSFAKAIAFARGVEGCPYVWGGTGPCGSGYDCSGLVMEAYLKMGITFGSSRPTAAIEWAYGKQVSSPQPGDLVFFPGSDGTWSSPGHVGIYLGPHELIDAYATGTLVRVESFGLPSSAPGLQAADVIGYTDP